MKKYVLLAAAASFALAPAAFAQETGSRSGVSAQQENLSAADQKFIQNAAVGGLFEVQSGELAETQAQSKEVKDFAEQMIEDHGEANEELASLAGELGAELPGQLDVRHAQILDSLKTQSGVAFDRAYIQAQRDAHREAVNLFSSYSRSGGNAELTSWAAKTLPTLQQHQQHVQQIGGVAQGEQPSGTGRSAAEPIK